MTYQDLHNRKTGVPSESLGLGRGNVPSSGGDDAIDLQEYIAIIMRRRSLIVATIAVVFILGLIYTFTRNRIYQSSAQIVVVAHNTDASSRSGNDIPLIADLQALTESKSIDTQKEIISSPDLLDKAYQRLSPEIRRRGFGRTKTKGEIPLWAYNISKKKDTDVLTVTCKAYDPNAAAMLANTIAETYFEQDVETNSRATKQACQYAEDQMVVIGKELRSAEKALAAYKRKTGVIDAATQLQKTAENMAKLQLDGDEAKTDFASNKRAISALRRQVSAQSPQILQNSTVTRNPEFMSTLDNINQLQMKRAATLQEYTPNSKEVKEINGQIKAEESRLKSITHTIVASQTTGLNLLHEDLVGKYADAVVKDSVLSARINAVTGILDGMKQQALGLPDKERGLSERMQRVGLLRNTYSMLSDKYYTLVLTERSVMPAGQLVSKARPADSPSYPQRKKMAVLYLLLGIMLSAVAALIAEKLDVRVHDQALVERMTGLPTLAVVPLVQDDTQKLISQANHNSVLLESYRILRSNIAFSAIDREMKLLAITSPGPGEGKSTAAANLAVAMAMDGKKVLIVDCDMRRPSLHRLFGVSRSVGFTNVITGQARMEEAIIQTSTENLYVLPSGPIPPNPPEVLNSNHTRELLKGLSQQYDMVIVDCPPCTGLSDVQVVSTIVEGILLVVSVNQSLKPHLDITMRILSQVEAPFIGTVLNKMDVRGNAYYYYYYYSYNYGSDGSTQDNKPGYERKRQKRGNHTKKS